MERIKNLIGAAKRESVGDMLALSQKISEELKRKPPAGCPRVKIAPLSSFTTKGLNEILLVKCCEADILPYFYEADYNQYVQDILNPESDFYKFQPDLAILFIDIQSLLGDMYFLPYELSDSQRRDWVRTKSAEIENLIREIENNSNTTVLCHNFEIPTYSPLGILENKQDFGFVEAIRLLNQELEKMAKKSSRLFIFDYDRFLSGIGKDNTKDAKMYYLGDVKFDWRHMPALCDAYMGYIKPLVSRVRKCIVLDLDNTLWGGIVGEDGFEGIKLGPTPEGRPYAEFQKTLLSLHKKGILLAINSKNNYEDGIKVIREHPHMALKEEHFASIQINWDDKITNMKKIAGELDIGLDALVFIDDDKVNRELVKSVLPQVFVVDLPEDPALFVSALRRLNDFNTFQLTEEDRRRGALYTQERLRKDFKAAKGLAEYLKELGTVATIKEADDFTIPRITQLTQRTNQFNMTTKRYQESDIRQFAKNKDFMVLSICAKDKFGDSGMVGCAIIETKKDKWYIDTFLLSCRVIGRKIEEALLAYILNKAKEKNAKTVEGEVRYTEKNKIARDFYKKCGFKLTYKESGKELCECGVTRRIPFPDCITLEENVFS